MSSVYDNVIKLLVIGDSYVGKSALVKRLVTDKFSDEYFQTIGVHSKTRMIAMDGSNIRLQVWDTAGIPKLNTVTPAYFDNAVGIVLVYSIADRQSFVNLKGWLQIVQKYASSSVQKVIIGNKADLEESREVQQEEAKQLASSTNSLFFEISAKSNHNIPDALSEVMRSIIANAHIEPLTRVSTTTAANAVTSQLTSSENEQKGKKKDKSTRKQPKNAECILS